MLSIWLATHTPSHPTPPFLVPYNDCWVISLRFSNSEPSYLYITKISVSIPAYSPCSCDYSCLPTYPPQYPPTTTLLSGKKGLQHRQPSKKLLHLASSGGVLKGPHLYAVDAEVRGGGEGGVAESGALLGPPLVQVLVKPEPKFARAGPDHQAGRASLDEQLVGSSPCVHLVKKNDSDFVVVVRGGATSRSPDWKEKSQHSPLPRMKQFSLGF